MTSKEQQTEERIIEAAREVFIEKGMAGARMQEIGDRAGINKALLHYYFRSKEKLFNAIFSKIIGTVSPMFTELLKDDRSLEDKITVFVSTYIDILLRNPFLPNFILNELTRNPDSLIDRFVKSSADPLDLFSPLDAQLKREGYSISVHDFVINSVSMVVFPVLAKPIIQNIFFDGNSAEYKEYIKQRKSSIIIFIMNALSGYKQ